MILGKSSVEKTQLSSNGWTLVIKRESSYVYTKSQTNRIFASLDILANFPYTLATYVIAPAFREIVTGCKKLPVESDSEILDLSGELGSPEEVKR